MLDTELQAGRELDTLIAGRVMGWQRCHAELRGGSGFPPGVSFSIHNVATIPAFSTDIAAAWAVVEHLEGQGYIVQLTSPDHLAQGQWRCALDAPLRSNGQYRTFTEEADTAPLAICRAALLAVGVE